MAESKPIKITLIVSGTTLVHEELVFVSSDVDAYVGIIVHGVKAIMSRIM